MNRIKSLDGLRGLCALMVAYSHFIGYNHAYILVIFFMSLSGFVLTHQFEKRHVSFKQFILLRTARILPLHLIVIFLFFLIYLLICQFYNQNFYQDLLEKLFYIPTYIFNLQGFIYPTNNNFVNAPSWSISIEYYANILIFLIAYKFKNYKYILTFIYVSLLFIYIFNFNNELPKYSVLNNLYYIGTSYFLTPIIGFLSGIIIYFVYQKINFNKNSSVLLYTSLEVILIILLLLSYRASPYAIFFSKIYLLIMPLAILLFSYGHGLLSKKIFEGNILQFLGKISFPLYLVHHVLKDFYVILDIRFFATNNYHIQALIWISLSIIIAIILEKADIGIYSKLKKHIKR